MWLLKRKNKMEMQNWSPVFRNKRKFFDIRRKDIKLSMFVVARWEKLDVVIP